MTVDFSGGVVTGHASVEPVALVDALPAGTRMFAGMQFRPLREDLEIWSFGAAGHTRQVADLHVVPCHYSSLPALLAEWEVALVQVAPPDADGRCSLGVGADYIADAARTARVVIAEVNAQMPVTRGPSLAYDSFADVVHTDRPLLEAPVARPSQTDRAIAQHIAAIVRDGDTIQVGIGGLPEAVLAALRDHRELRVHSGFVSDGVLDLLECGAVSHGAVCGIALGSARLYAACGERDDIAFAPTSFTHDPVVLADVGRIVAINAALEVDRVGNVGSESIGGRVVGAIGGQVDFLRAAARSGGDGIIAIPAARVVDTLSGPVTVGAADVDWIVTEHGARRLRGLTTAQRRHALQEIS